MTLQACKVRVRRAHPVRAAYRSDKTGRMSGPIAEGRGEGRHVNTEGEEGGRGRSYGSRRLAYFQQTYNVILTLHQDAKMKQAIPPSSCVDGYTS
jgi:hypothetical protein